MAKKAPNGLLSNLDISKSLLNSFLCLIQWNRLSISSYEISIYQERRYRFSFHVKKPKKKASFSMIASKSKTRFC